MDKEIVLSKSDLGGLILTGAAVFAMLYWVNHTMPSQGRGPEGSIGVRG